MKSEEELNALKNKVETLNKKFALLPDDALQQVTGGYSESGTLENILQELTCWLDKHPNATKSEIYDVLKEKANDNSIVLTEDELNFMNQLLNSFAS